MEPASLGLVTGLVLDSSVLIAAERRKLTAAQAIENVQKTIGEGPVVLSVVTIAEIGLASIAPARRKFASAAARSWTI